MFPLSNLSVLNLESCGGLIPIQGLLPRGSILLNYHSKNTSEHGENCLWTLDTSNKKGYRSSIKAKITLLVSGTVDSHSGLSVVDWKSMETDDNLDWILSHQELTPSAPIYESKTWDFNVYLSHSSRKGSSTGFLLLLSLLGTDTETQGYNFGSTNQCGNKSYGVAKKHDKFSMSISPPKPRTTFTVNSLTSKNMISSCSGIDSLDIYEIRVKNCPNRLVRLCGRIPSPISYTSQYPLLVTFYTSRRDKVETKFMISWK